MAQPHHGWLPITLEIEYQQFQFCASNVVNDPATELLAAALWLIAPGESLPSIGPSLNPPYTADDIRGVHFWREREWHTLLIRRLDNRTHASFVFYHNHDGGLHVGPDDFRTSDRTYFDRLTITEFCTMVHWSLTGIAESMAPILYNRHWVRPFPGRHLIQLSEELSEW